MYYVVIGDMPIPGFKWIFCPMGLREFYIHRMAPCYLQTKIYVSQSSFRISEVAFTATI